MNNIIASRISLLREEMRKINADWYLITSEDSHGSEYVSDYFNVREYYTGFTGDNAVLLINMDSARMWTDGRFFIQAAKELAGTGIELMRMGEEGVPRVSEFIKANIKKGETLCFDGTTLSYSQGLVYETVVKKNKGNVISDCTLAGDLWKDRPSLPDKSVFMLSDDIAGESITSRLSRIRAALNKENANAFLLSKLDDIMWITNLRGNDVFCNPVLLSYLYIDLDEVFLFADKRKISRDIENELKRQGVCLKAYDEIASFTQKLSKKNKVLISGDDLNYTLANIVKSKAKMILGDNPSTLMKAIKNETELSRMRDVTLEDSAIVTKFIYWLKSNIGSKEITEISASDYLDNLRSGVKDYVSLSFPTISAYGPNAAMMHYEATRDKFSPLKAEGFLLVDSGGQYKRGTTDITRTIVLGPVTEDMKLHFSKVCAGMLAIADAKFLYGCTGRNLDILARLPLWKLGIDYKCGTGHGVGYCLNVHEGPHSLRWQYRKGLNETVLEEGMVVTDEPGVYLKDKYGIRTENEIVCVKDVKNEDGQFMKFEHMTYAPIDREALDKKYLSKEDIERIDSYHAEVYEKIRNYLSEEERKWLFEVTRPL